MKFSVGLLVTLITYSICSCSSDKPEQKSGESVISGEPTEEPERRDPLQQETAEKAEVTAGQKVYQQYCLVCHQVDGEGVAGLNPPLSGTDWVTGDKERLIKVILQGLEGQIEIKGEVYDNAMPANDYLSDRQIADVLTYIRSHFGNEASAITPEEVADVRAKIAS